MRANPYESPPLDALPTGRRKTIYWPSWFWSLFVGFTFVSCVNATITWTPPYSMMAPAVSVVTGGAALIFAVLTVYKTMRHHQSLWKRWD